MIDKCKWSQSFKRKKMQSVKKEKGRFPKTSYNYVSVLFIIKRTLARKDVTISIWVLFIIKGTLAGKDVTICISPVEDKSYINPKLRNQLVISESNVIEKLDVWDKKQYDITIYN